MKILVIGATGFLSGAMVRGAAGRRHEVFGVSRGKRASAVEGATLLVADREDATGFEKVVAGAGRFDLVVDCIGFNAGHARQDLSVFFPERGEVRAGQLVFISSDFACAAGDRPWMIDETFDRFETTSYGGGKRAAEEVLLAAAKARGLPITILRPGHIYGPGSELGCLPHHGRDVELLARIDRGEALKLVGGGWFLQQPIFVEDLVEISLGLAGNQKAFGELYVAPGAEIITSRQYYQMVGGILGKTVTMEEASIDEFLKAKPEGRSFCSHRVYDQSKAKRDGVPLARTPMREGLRQHVEWLRNRK